MTDLDNSQNQNDMFLKILFFIFGLIFLILIFFVILNIKKDSKNLENKTELKKKQSLELVRKGTLKSKSNLEKNLVNQQLEVDILANSNNTPIVGFDFVLKFDNVNLQFLNAKSLNDDFDIRVNTKQKNLLRVTGFKKIGITQDSILKDSSVVAMTFKPLKKGDYKMDFVFVKGETGDTNLIDKNGNDILGEVDNFSLNIIE